MLESDSFSEHTSSSQSITVNFTFITLYEDEYEAYSNRTNEIFGNNIVDFLAPVMRVEIERGKGGDVENMAIVSNGTVFIDGYE